MTATSWELIGRDDTGAMINIDYTCPNCGMVLGDLAFIGEKNLDKLDGDFEIDLKCVECKTPFIAECREDSRKY